MKIFTIETCGECPAHRPRSDSYYNEHGRCGRVDGLTVLTHHKPPELCPLKDWKEK